MKKGLTLIEVLVSTFILAVVAAGLVNLFVTSKRYLAITSSRMAGSEIGKAFLDPLQGQVRQDTWDIGGNNLRIPPAVEFIDSTGAALTINGIVYTPNYRVSRVRDTALNDTGLRRVVVTITWPPIN